MGPEGDGRVRRPARLLGDGAASAALPVTPTVCNGCGAAVQWLTADQARARDIDLGPAFEFFGIREPADVWTCTECDNVGVIGAPEHGP